MAARIVEVAEAVKTLLTTTTGGPPAVTITRSWRPETNRDKLAFAGRLVRVFPERVADVGILSRDEDEREYAIIVQVIEKCEEQVLADEWVDGLVEWVDEKVYQPLGDLRNAETSEWEALFGPTLYPWGAEITTVCDYELLAKSQTFESILRFAFREDV